ncbi:MAG TPA: NADH-quinone oxidoreductase subunit L [Marinilabiliales bacterium]|nr:MAG: NADH-quinone oxidoreductase subunit L [Bacteroidetes bacterium GWC2_40_13]OFX72250.1 MAG: NADH-quinone oxidoreductase subunit L [Bacteroidetes bacterium GWD2_40_43]OFX90502.1 MAG: NADH-quinone oxidoreductase subunit L [Bacteroidetes bacterium GWE2_40_63]OFY17252.1 MAG: NADH-quinone oxidoreductase subunit L [Bacteroidetes bacterium GWF2_40_13]OFZ29084.1 MAG: NADH-quinone oxidoreductase subunit L [Bacteroidetes bacterium RIFOXYC2_FULL_40_12]HAN00815.1 NADH-quinone oxidoreductase subunit 
MNTFSYTFLIPILPLLMFLFIGLTGHKFKPIVSGVIGTVSLGIVTLLSYATAIQYFWGVGKIDEVFQTIIPYNYTWLQFWGNFKISMGILLDPISVMMLVVVSTVSFMVHIYSIGYMKGDGGFSRFFSFLSLFSFSMLGLVLATNIFQMYIFWELVGVSSFLLIGYYYEKPSAVAASKKAFIVTRFADFGFLIGILILSFYTGTFDFGVLTNPETTPVASMTGITFMGVSVVSWAMILIFAGGAGKSAMFPLHIWLPDAMEGPTPVSALIHAATMVVAGVYLVARMFVVYHFYAPGVQELIGYVGGFTSLFAAIIAITQFDIKRVLAFSTLSQIGYMMLALGVSGYGAEHGVGYMASMFHLFTHAMFKALLFLGAGSVIHAVHSNYMYDMGGLRKYMPITHITFLIATLTIAGVPFLSGFFSKDEILVAAFEHNKLLFAIEFLVAGITAFYMFRLYFNVFWGEDKHYHHTPHESPLVMTIPLMILAFGAIFAGYLPFAHMISPDKTPMHLHLHWNIAIPSVLIGLAGIALAWVLYKKKNPIPDKLASAFGTFYTTVYHKFYIDEIYLFVTHKILFNMVSRPVAWFDRHIVDGTMNGVAFIVTTSSNKIKGLQSGQLQQYAAVFIAGALGLVLLGIYFLQ